MQQTIKQVNVDEFLGLTNSAVMVDVRTPAEYAKGHIPGSHNIPLFTNDERVIIGTTYKQVGKQEAIELGLEIVGPKMATIVREAKALSGGKPLLIYCWRGGMRSGSVGWLLQMAGMKVYQLTGGYKQYRKHFYELMKRHSWQFVNLGGRTGSGKTEILHHLTLLGEQVIDLEGLANHRGSAYGQLGLPPQPTNEHFENLLHHTLTRMMPDQRIWVESESQRIGCMFIADEFYRLISQCPLINIIIPTQKRIERLVRDYACFPKEMLLESSMKIKKRLGGLVMQQVTNAIEQGDFTTVAALTLQYYDKTYDYGFTMRNTVKVVLEFDHDNPQTIAHQLIQTSISHIKSSDHANC